MNKQKFECICISCGNDRVVHDYDLESAWRTLQGRGWVIDATGGMYCPECKSDLNLDENSG